MGFGEKGWCRTTAKPESRTTTSSTLQGGESGRVDEARSQTCRLFESLLSGIRPTALSVSLPLPALIFSSRTIYLMHPARSCRHSDKRPLSPLLNSSQTCTRSLDGRASAAVMSRATYGDRPCNIVGGVPFPLQASHPSTTTH